MDNSNPIKKKINRRFAKNFTIHIFTFLRN